MDSRSFGIHPVCLELLAELGLAQEFMAGGQPIEMGRAYIDRQCVGTLSFRNCPPPFRLVLAIPQYLTERILERKLNALDPSIMQRDTEVTDVVQNGDKVAVHCRDGGGGQRIFEGDFVIGCDGVHSAVRRLAGITFNGTPYPDVYVMGDFSDNTGRRREANIYLHRDGLIESFPFPEGRRRWVVKTELRVADCKTDDIVRRIKMRIGHDLSRCECFMLSSFGAEHYLAESFVKDRLILAGDAAHVISPIGGQGMNLGWLGARDLAQTLHGIYHEGSGVQSALLSYERRRWRAAAKARRRAEFNMALGRKYRYPGLRKAIVWGMLHTPLCHVMARVFTMRGLDTWPL